MCCQLSGTYRRSDVPLLLRRFGRWVFRHWCGYELNFGENEMNLTLESPLNTLSRECERMDVESLYIMTEASTNQQRRSFSKYYVKHLKRCLRKDFMYYCQRIRRTTGLSGFFRGKWWCASWGNLLGNMKLLFCNAKTNKS